MRNHAQQCPPLHPEKKVCNVNSSELLELWRLSLVANVRSDAPDLSARQMALLLTVYQTEAPHTVRGLAQFLSISKPAVSRALDRLGSLGYIRRERDETDRRNVLVQKTEGGSAFLQTFSALAVAALQQKAGTNSDAARHESDQDQTATTPENRAWVDVAA